MRSAGNEQSRREVLKLGIAAATLGGAAALPAYQATAHSRDGRSTRRPDRTKNIIFMVSDGMSIGVPTLAEPFSQLVRSRGTRWATLAASPETVHGQLVTSSLDSLVTDSAAAASAWGSGSLVANGAINMLPDGTALTPLAPLAKATGRAIGLVTTTRITHATPAGFAAIVPRRGLEATIAEQYLDQVDLLLGGGAIHFDAASRSDGRDLFEAYREREYTIATSRKQMRAAGHRKMLGLFASSHLPYTIDRRQDEVLDRRVPTLAEMTDVALRQLAKENNGFLLQVEGGRIDHAAHANDAAGTLWDQLEFDDAIGVAMAFLDDHPDTLIVITSDHGNANPGLNGMGGGYRQSTECFERLASFKASFATISSELRRIAADADEDQGDALPRATAMLHRLTGLELHEDEVRTLIDARLGRDVCEANNQLAGFAGQCGQVLGNHAGVQWTGVTHTADWVLSLAIGSGREDFAGLMQHTDLYDRLTGRMGIAHRNPAMSPDDLPPGRRRGIGLGPPHELDALIA